MSREFVIGTVAKQTGVSAKTIRYYEETGLIPAAVRAANGYRVYDERAVHLLRFVKRARDLGFSMEDVGNLLALWADEKRSSAEVKKLATKHLLEIERKIEELRSLHRTMQKLVTGCRGDNRPDCPILDDLAQESQQETGEKQ